MKRIFFVRHGQTQANSDGLASGSEWDTQLTFEGKKQALETGKLLKNKKIDLIVSSTISRALHTAEIIAKEIGYDPKKILKSDFFIERNFGIYSGKPDAEYQEAALEEKMHESVETAEAMHMRIMHGLEWVKGLKGNNIVIVSHGGVSRILRLMHQNLPLSHMYKLEKQPNASIYEFDL